MLKFIIPILLLLLAAVYFFYTQKPLTLPRPRDPRVAAPSISPPEEVVASGLEIPWDIVFLPANTGALMTERPGRVRFLKPDWTLAPDPVLALSDVVMEGEGGLLGIALHPSFPNPPQVYLYYTYRSSGGLKNQVARFTYSADTLTQQTPVITDIPADSNHNGGRLAFSPDGFLYITTGDAGDPQSAQDTSSLSGKILRLNPDGSIPADNPFSNPVWSYGHRNPQGLAWDDQGRLWSVEHGASATDELNLITKGANYGWPDVRGKDTGPGITSPVLQSGAATWAPADIIFYRSFLYFTGLRGQALYQVNPDNPSQFITHLRGRFGRLRSLTLGPDNSLFITTSNRDGRGSARRDDDRLLHLKL